MIIDTLYEGAIKTLTEQGKIMTISQKIISLKRIDEKVLYVQELLEGLNAFPKILEVTKSENISTYYRNLGNKEYQQADNYRAWQYYNLSLLHAPIGSECFSLALSNRSAVFFSMNKINECLNDIDNVLSIKHPDTLKEKLIKRKEACKGKKIEGKDDSISALLQTLTLHDSQEPRFPCASSKLEVVFSQEMGRHVIARTDIKVGEILVQEQPYFTLLLKSQSLFNCSYCLSTNLNLSPCHNCCFALYCSEKCKEKAWKEYHEIECPMMPMLIEMEFTKLELLALRAVIKARSDHADWNDLFKTIKEAEENENSEFRGHVKVNNDWVYDSQYYASIHTLASNLDKRSVSDVFQKAVSASVFLWLLENTTSFLHSDNEEKKIKIKKCVAGTLLHHIMTSPTNMHGISTNVQNALGHYVDEFSIASAPYPFHSLINHSCTPNVVRFNRLGTGMLTLIALRPIKKGMQLFDNYGSHHAIQDRLTRQQYLKFQYKFMCLCEACLNDWPTYLAMKPSTKIPAKIKNRKNKLLGSDVLNKLQQGDLETAQSLLKPLCELAGDLDPYAPCIELSDCQESLKQCFQILHGVLPYGYSNLVEWSPIPPKVT